MFSVNWINVTINIEIPFPAVDESSNLETQIKIMVDEQSMPIHAIDKNDRYRMAFLSSTLKLSRALSMKLFVAPAKMLITFAGI